MQSSTGLLHIKADTASSKWNNWTKNNEDWSMIQQPWPTKHQSARVVRWFVIIFQELNFLHTSINTIVTRRLDITETHKENCYCYFQYCMHHARIVTKEYCDPCKDLMGEDVALYLLWYDCPTHTILAAIYLAVLLWGTTHILASAEMADCI